MANNKNITFDQLQSSMTKIKGEIDKKANTNHGTHVKYYDDNPKVAGTVTAGRSSRLSRGDHVHPAQTTITGNAGTATKLQTARTLTIGNTGKAFDGSGNVTWTLSDIGAAAASHNHTSLTGVTKLQFAADSTDSAIMKVTTEEASTYLDFEMNDDVNTDMYRWRFSAYDTNGTTPYFNLMTLTAKDTSSARLTVNGDVTASSFTGNASSATKLQTARAIKIGNTSRNFDGTGNVTWTLNEIGAAPASHTHANVVMNNCSNKDLNTIKTAGFYYGYTGMTNAPVQTIAVLEVLVYSPDWIVQRFTVIGNGGKKYERHYYNGDTWSAWRTLYDSANKPTPADIGAAAKSHTHTNLTTKTVSNRTLALGTELYQYAAITSNNTIINLPSVSSFTEIHLFFDWPSGISIIMPSNVKWQEGVMYGPGHTHEFIFTYVNSDIGWLGGCVVYG